MNNKKEYLQGVTIRDLVESDREKCKGLGFEHMLSEGYKIIEYNDLFVLISKWDYDAFGKERLVNVIYLEHSNVLENDFLKIDFERIANDEEYNKPKTIEVKFVENINGTNESIFRNINEPNKYYMRQDTANEKVAKWYSAYKYKGEWTDNAPIRTNITFKMGEQLEKVTFTNWNSSGVYPENYNEAFSYERLQHKDEIKTLKDWEKSSSRTITDYLKVGDIIDEEMYNHFLNILPPITDWDNMLQVGGVCECIKDDNGKFKNTFLTFKKEEAGWVFMGECFRCESVNKNPKLEISQELDEPDFCY